MDCICKAGGGECNCPVSSRARLNSWLSDNVAISARLGFPIFGSPSDLKVAIKDMLIEHDKWMRVTGRLLVLASCGYDMGMLIEHVGDTEFLSDRWLVEWYGRPLSPELLAGMERMDRAVTDGAESSL